MIYANGPRILKACVAAAGGRMPVLFHVHNYLGQRYAVRIAGRSIRGGDVTLAACCNHVAKPLASFVPAGRLHIVPNGVPDVPYSPPPKPQVRIGLIGRMSSEKGHLVFIEAAREVARELPQGVFVICGSPAASGDAYFDSVRQAAEGLPFEFIPWQPRIDAVLRASACWWPHLFKKVRPRVILEAFSAGVPVLASAVGGIPEIVEEGRNGFLSASWISTRTGAPDLHSWSRTPIACELSPPTLGVTGNASTTWRSIAGGSRICSSRW